ncbi:putative glycosyltransferase [Burkholderiales bacterium GJ-E10]|nr:putative glycosyltransferase [Burkholderiales bacterium GJ-E10]
MKILYLNADSGIPVLGDKGASVHVREFTAAAAALGHEVVLACAALGEGNPPPPARLLHLEMPNDPEVVAAVGRRLGIAASELETVEMRRELRRIAYDDTLVRRTTTELSRIGFRPDVVYERHSLLCSAGAEIAAHYGVARILEVNAPLVDEQARYRGLRLVDRATAMQAASYRGAQVVVAVSDAVAAHVRQVVGYAVRVEVVPNGVDTERFGTGGKGDEIRRAFGLGDGTVIGFIGSFKPWHGVDLLIRAFEEIASGHPSARLVAVGDGPDWAAARDRVAASSCAGQVLLPGRVPHADIPHWLEAMDVTAAPYAPQDDFYFSPLKIIESLAAGRPVVAPRLGQITDIVQDGATGVLYEPGSVRGCAQALGVLLAQPQLRQRMAENARAFAGECSWKRVVGTVLGFDIGAAAGLGA